MGRDDVEEAVTVVAGMGLRTSGRNERKKLVNIEMTENTLNTNNYIPYPSWKLKESSGDPQAGYFHTY
jgi:hypothetical protein